MIRSLLVFSDLGLFILRFFLGIILIAHGWPKLKNLKETANNFQGMGFKPGIFWAFIVALLEFVGGLFLIFGFLTQIITFFLVIEFLVILARVKRKSPLVGGSELDFLILAVALALMSLGGGYYSLDNFLGIRI